eukprot:SAG22_NODE_16883_length_315_cov_1.194444_1_plen_44_part_10
MSLLPVTHLSGETTGMWTGATLCERCHLRPPPLPPFRGLLAKKR